MHILRLQSEYMHYKNKFEKEIKFLIKFEGNIKNLNFMINHMIHLRSVCINLSLSK